MIGRVIMRCNYGNITTKNKDMIELQRVKFYIRKNLLVIIAVLISLSSILTVFIKIRIINISLAILTILLILGFFIYHNRAKKFYYISLTDPKHSNSWFGRGSFKYDITNKSFLIEGISTGNDSAQIYKNCISWNDYEFSFNFKILKSCLGIVVRAIDVSNFIMLQINQDGIRPHIKINEQWAIEESKPTNLLFEKKLSPDSWYRCVLNCERNTIYIKVFNKKSLLFDRFWDIPKALSLEGINGNKKKTDIPSYIIINFYNGSVGFRNSRGEKALVRNVYIKEL